MIKVFAENGAGKRYISGFNLPIVTATPRRYIGLKLNVETMEFHEFMSTDVPVVVVDTFTDFDPSIRSFLSDMIDESSSKIHAVLYNTSERLTEKDIVSFSESEPTVIYVFNNISYLNGKVVKNVCYN